MSQLKTIQIIHFAFCASIFLFASVVLLLTKDKTYFSLNFNNPDPITFVAPLVAIFGVNIGPCLFKKTLGNTAQENLETSSKLVRYQTAFIIKMAFLESGALINIVAYFITFNLFFMLFAALCFTAIVLSRPSKDSVYTTLGIQDTEIF